MKATITSGELKGVEFEISEETVTSIKEKRVPKHVRVGQVYHVEGDKRMVAALDCNGVGLTSVGKWSGCYSSITYKGITTNVKMRQILVEKSARYLGDFGDVFEIKETKK